MSKIDELINSLCPNGVEFYELKNKSLFNFYYGKGNKIPEDIGGEYDVYGANGVVSHINEYNCEDVSIIGHIGAVGMVNRCKGKCFVTYNGTIAEVVDKERVNSQFLYYILTTLNLPSYKKGSQPFLSVSDFENICIPIPPLEIQNEIVRILDSFTLLSEELLNEMKARKKQYEYYIEKLIASRDCEMLRLEQLCDFYNGDRGKNYPKVSEMVDEGIPFVNAGDVDGTVDYKNCNKITREKYNSMNGAKLQKNDILYCLRGSTGKNGIYEMDEGTIASSLVAIRANEKVNYKFLYYLLNSSLERKQRIMFDTGAAQPNLSVQNIKKYEFPIPNVEEQIKIVKVLDKFDKLCNDIHEGLPAEMEKRKKQYEYYRDKLLNFKEAMINE